MRAYDKIESVLGWRPRTPLREGLARTIAFYRENRQNYSGFPCIYPSSI